MKPYQTLFTLIQQASESAPIRIVADLKGLGLIDSFRSVEIRNARMCPVYFVHGPDMPLLETERAERPRWIL